ncbi:1-phosphatidylinositol-3-phosphate 5-kinase FAB1B [Raphanus sativus]|nr:1-phosphatidylinositol-3-phosphate 5-kinase FAB1B [Raphanus sativus]
MDPGGYVKVKCLASGFRHDSMVVKGVVCKRNVAHRRMRAKIENARLLILGGALEYQRVSNSYRVLILCCNRYLLRGANEEELKKVKHVVQYGVFAAYHLALETSFLADEGASPDLPLNSPITVALPDKSMSIERSISTVPGFMVSAYEKSPTMLTGSEPQRANSVPASELLSTTANLSIQKDINPLIPNGSGWQAAREVNPGFTFSRYNVPLNLPDHVKDGRNANVSERSALADTPADKATQQLRQQTCWTVPYIHQGKALCHRVLKVVRAL